MIFNNILKITISIIVTTGLLSCRKAENIVGGDSVYHYIPRDCDYLFIKNNSVDSSAYYSLSKKELEKLLDEGHEAPLIIRKLSSSETKANHYCMTLDVTSYTPEMAEANHDAIYSDFMSEPDLELEGIMAQELRLSSRKTKSSSMPMTNLIRLEYRKVELKSLKVMSTSTLFGIDPKIDLSEHFEIFGDESNQFLFNHRKKLLGRLERGMGIDKYLALRPIVNPSLYIHLKDMPPEVPVNTDFIVEMELDGGKVLRDTTTVTLTR